jgi:GalNAc-alpha-(1->4)-GalNAc-alpha-(1->3)-diNAcBac-PP-undecaprenol alpha-1,4-N-acetyl-D-galactosaminyltransferase
MNLKLEDNNYVMLFPSLLNLHAVKCTGQICENIAIFYKKNVYILTHNTEDYSNFRTYCPNVKLLFLRGKLDDPIWKLRFNNLMLIIKNAKKINTLSLYYAPGHAIFDDLILILYKLLNRHGKLHVRFEFEIYNLDNSYPFNRKNGKITTLRHVVNYFFFKSIDILGVLDHDNFILSRQKRFWDIFLDKKKIKQQFNGYIDFPELDQIDFKGKKDVICLAGRLDSQQKGLHVFLDAIENVDIKNWQIYLLGTLSNSQKSHIKRICDNNKSLKGKIHVKGHIYNTEVYWQYLLRSKIFCLPSLNDGIPLVIPDAMARGNAILCSDLYGLKNIIANDNDIGLFFKKGDAIDLAEKLQVFISNPSLVEEMAKNGISRANKFLNWKDIVKNLDL